MTRAIKRTKKTPKLQVAARPKRKPTKQAEMTRLGSIFRSLGGLGGAAIGSLVGHSSMGLSVGTDLGAALSRWLGSGDYMVSSNTLVSKASSGVPMMHKTSQSVVVRHREYICDITGSAAFAIAQTLPLNPGLAVTFPWLSTIATQFQEYTFRGVVFHYIPTSGDAVSSTNSALGSVIASTSYRSTAPAFTNKQQMLNEYFSGDAKPAETFCHPIECDPKENPFNVQYVRTGAVPTGEDQKMYDLGTTYIATQGQQAAFICGELWVSYEVELRKPVLAGAYLPEAAYAIYTMTGTVNSANPLGTTAATKVSDTFLNGGLGLTNNTITIPAGNAGRYLYDYSIEGASAAVIGFGTLVNMTVVNMACGVTPAATQYPNWSSETYTAAQSPMVMIFNITDPTKSASITTTATLTGSIAGQIRLYEINGSAT